LKFNREFKNLHDAKIFRDIIQLHVDFDMSVCPTFIELYKDDNKYISKTIYNTFQLKIKKNKIKNFFKTFKTLEEAKEKRIELLQKYFSL